MLLSTACLFLAIYIWSKTYFYRAWCCVSRTLFSAWTCRRKTHTSVLIQRPGKWIAIQSLQKSTIRNRAISANIFQWWTGKRHSKWNMVSYQGKEVKKDKQYFLYHSTNRLVGGSDICIRGFGKMEPIIINLTQWEKCTGSMEPRVGKSAEL